jgi:hypothetical protein
MSDRERIKVIFEERTAAITACATIALDLAVVEVLGMIM